MTPAQQERKRARDRAYGLTHRDERIAARAALRAAHPERERAYGRAYGLAHRDERIARGAAWRATHPEQVRAYGLAHRDERIARGAAWRATHPARKRASRRAYYVEHRDEQIAASRVYQAAHPEQNRESVRAYRAAHPEERRAHGSRRRARKSGNGGSHTAQEWLELVARAGGRCAYCSIVPVGALHRDHDVPLARGGSDDIANIAAACPRCNLRKGTATGAEFRARLAREASA